MRLLFILLFTCCLRAGALMAAETLPPVPPALLPQANEAKAAFEKGDFPAAEATYRKMLEAAPDNLYLLSSLGVVLFREKKLKDAQDCFEKVIKIDPGDGFSHCTLGVVYYTQGRYEAAIDVLSRAIAIDARNATAHNYLGVTWSQKGRQAEAQKEFEAAIAIDPDYADAAYNFAVLLATKSSPENAKAREYYQRARKLGAVADPALERLLSLGGN